MDGNWISYLVYILTFIAVVALVEGLYLWWSSLNVDRKIKVSRRLRLLSAAGVRQDQALNLLKTEALSENPTLNALLLKIPRIHSLDRLLEQSGLDMSISKYLLSHLLIFMLSFSLLALLLPSRLWLCALLALVLAIILPLVYIKSAQGQRMRRIGELLPETMDYIARSMRAGNPFSASVKGAATEMPEPMASELRTTFDEVNYGVDMEQALSNLCMRTGNLDLRYFTTAVLVQRSTGGNLAEVLTRIAGVMRSRAAMTREVAALSAEMHYSAKILIALPFFMALLIQIVNPGYLAILIETRIGLILIGIQIFLMAVGWYVIKQMINFRV